MIDYNIGKSPTELVASIDTVLLKAWRSKDKPHELDYLSTAILELPSLLNGLGYYLAEAESDMDMAKDRMQYEEMKAIDTLLKSGVKAVNKAELQVAISDEQRVHVDAYFIAKREYRLLKNKYDAVSKSFEGMRSRLSVIKNDLREA